MKKLILSAAFIAAFAFTGCSDDDNSENCKTCSLSDTEYTVCDLGNGKVKVTIAGKSQEIDLPEGVSFKDFNFCEASFE